MITMRQSENKVGAFTLLSPAEQKAITASGISYSFGAKGSCTLTKPCAGATISCSSATGDCQLGDYNEYLGMYMAIICDGKKYTCADWKPQPEGSGVEGSGTDESGTFFGIDDDEAGSIKLL